MEAMREVMMFYNQAEYLRQQLVILDMLRGSNRRLRLIGIAVDTDGNAYVTDILSLKIFRLHLLCIVKMEEIVMYLSPN